VNQFNQPYFQVTDLEIVMEEQKIDIMDLTAHIVANYVGNNSAAVGDLPSLIKNVHAALAGISAPQAPPVEQKTPAVSVKKSITPDAIICLEDGRKFKSLKRHLRTKYNLSPEEYRAKWGLPKDYPMVAPSYAAARSTLAKSMGLGQGGRRPAAAAPVAKTRKAKAAPAG
jgi:predicted transcriptional regulator